MNRIIQGDCIEELKKLKPNSVDAIITDPPYGIGFMGKEWDNFKQDFVKHRTRNYDTPEIKEHIRKSQIKKISSPANEIGGSYDLSQKGKLGYQNFCEEWSKEALRILKPGGFMLVSCSTRMYHRMACGIEDAGFEIRDTIMWLYGSGFPKSLNIGKQIDKMAGRTSDKEKEISQFLKQRRLELKLSMKEVEEKMGWNTWLNWIEGRNYLGQFIIQLPNWKDYQKLKEIYKIDNRFDEFIKEAEREITGKDGRGELKEDMFFTQDNKKAFESGKSIGYGKWDLKDKPATPEAKQWEGWGTALKPAVEPIVVARKPLSEKNVALNVLKWGTGGINIDECRIGNDLIEAGRNNRKECNSNSFGEKLMDTEKQLQQGRFPANIILDEEAGKMLDEQSGFISQSGRLNRINNKVKANPFKGFSGDEKTNWTYSGQEHFDKGGASRFFYCAKASKSERNFGCEEMTDKTTDDGREAVSDRPHQRGASQRKNNHPTVKPIKLMEYLIKLVSPMGGTVLDPFIGSGTTAIACLKLNRKYIGIEKEEEYVKIANARIKPYLEQRKLI